MITTALLVGITALAAPRWLATAAATTVKPQATAAAAAVALQPNELGEIMFLEYHLIGTPEADWRRTPDNFRKDLTMLYENGYYPVPLMDVLKGTIKVPKGKTPFVLTFDDSSQGQFRYLQEDGKLVIDPNCGVGIMEAFKKQHPDFPLTATFYVLPAIPPKLRLFGQEEYIQQKLEWLVKNGYEIGSHTYWHQNLAKTDDLGVQKQMVLTNQAVQSYVPGYEVKNLALPFGVHAKNRVLEHAGEYQGIKYRYHSVVLVGSGPNVSPFSTKFDPYRIERIQAGDTPWGPKAFVETYKQKPALRFVSDGDPTTVTVPKTMFDKVRAPVGMKVKGI